MLLTKAICDRYLKILQHLSSSNLPSFVVDSHLEKLISLSATRSIKQADVGSPCWKNLGSLIEMSREVIRVAYAPSISVHCFPIRFRVMPYFEYGQIFERCSAVISSLSHVLHAPAVLDGMNR